MSCITLGNDLLHQGKFQEAIDIFNNAVEEGIDLGNAYNGLAVAYHCVKNYDNALVNSKKALEIEPENIDYLVNLANIYTDSKNFSEAITILTKIVELVPNDHLYHNQLGQVLQLNGDYLASIKHFSLAIDLCNTNANYLASMGLSYKKYGDELIAEAKDKITTRPNYDKACISAIIGDFDKAFEFLQKAIIDGDSSLISWVYVDPDLSELRKQSRFWEIMP